MPCLKKMATTSMSNQQRKYKYVLDLFHYALAGRLKILKWKSLLTPVEVTMPLLANRPLLIRSAGNVYGRNFLSDFFLILKNMQNRKNGSESLKESSQALLQQLLECAIACEHCAMSCLNEEQVNMMTRCIELDRDCADTCLHTAKLVTRESEISDVILAVCEKICRICAEECRKHNNDHCRTCAEICERCAEACHEHHGHLQLQ
jgi:hypothetical protein